jgi:hypothetical protein
LWFCMDFSLNFPKAAGDGCAKKEIPTNARRLKAQNGLIACKGIHSSQLV